MTRLRSTGGFFAVSVLAAYLLALMPVPESLAVLKPFWLALVLIYWTLEAPERMGLGLAFSLGLVGDLATGTLFGEQALRLIVLTFIVLRFRSRIRFFPMWQQSLAVLALLLNDRAVVLMIRAFAGDGLPPWSFWLAPLAGTLLWPWLFLLFDDLRSRLRARES